MSASENDNLNNQTNANSESIQEVDQSLMSAMLTAISLKNSEPSPLIDFAGDDKSLQLIAQDLHNILSTPGAVKFSAENKNNLELIIQSFITFSIQNSSQKIDDSNVKNLQKEVFEAKNKIENYKYLLNNAEKSIEKMSNDNKELQNKNDSLYRDNANTLNKMKKIKQEYENQITEIKNENYKLKEKLEEMQDDTKIREYATKRNLEQFSDLASQATKSNDKIEKLKEKMKKKNRQIKVLQSENQKMKLNNQMLEDEIQKMKASLSAARGDLEQMKKKMNGDLNKSKKKSARTSQLTNSNNCEQLQTAIISISDQFERQSGELIQLRKSHILCTSLLQKQVEIVSEYEKEINRCEKMAKQNSSMMKELKSTKGELIQTLETLNSKNKFIKSLMNMCKVQKEEEVPLYFLKVREYGIIENRRLVAAFEDNLRFMTNLFNSSLAYDDQNIPLNEDKQFINSLQFEVSRTRQFIIENTVNDDSISYNQAANINPNLNQTTNQSKAENQSDYDSNNSKNSNISSNSQEELNEEELIQNQKRSDLALLTSQILRNEILRKYSEKLKHNSESFAQIVDLFGCNEDPDSTAKVIFENEALIKSFIENSLKLIKGNLAADDINDNFAEEEDLEHNDRKQVFDEISDFIESSVSIFNEIKEILKFDGENHEIPFMVEELIHKNEALEKYDESKSNKSKRNKNKNKPLANSEVTTRAIELDDQNSVSSQPSNKSDTNNSTQQPSNKSDTNNNTQQPSNKSDANNNAQQPNNKNGTSKNTQQQSNKNEPTQQQNSKNNQNSNATKQNQNNRNDRNKPQNNEKKKSINESNDDNLMLDDLDEDTEHIILEANHQLRRNAEEISEHPKPDWKKRIRSCALALKRLNRDNKKLKQQLAEAQQHIKEAEKQSSSRSKTLVMMTDSYKSLEKYNNDLLTKNRELTIEMEKRSQLADDRVFKVLDQEREQHLIEIENLQNKNNSIIERLKAKVEDKKKKNISIKKKLKEVILSYEDAFKQQKQTIAYLRNQIDSSVNNLDNDNELLKKIQQLNSQLKASESQRQNLEMKIDQIQDEGKKSLAIRDTFWKGQIAIVEQNVQTEADKSKQAVLDALANQFNCEPNMTSIVNSYYLHDNDQLNRGDAEIFPKDFSQSSKIETQVQMKLNEWETWGRSLFTSLKNGEVFMYNSKDLRFLLGEMIMSSLSQRFLLNRLDSLRIQKKFLLSPNSNSQFVNESPQIRSLLIIIVFFIRVRKNMNYLPLQNNME